MTREDFDSLVRRVEQRFANRPAALRWRVVMLAAIGYAGLLAGFGVILLISAGFFLLMYWVDVEAKIACGIMGTMVFVGGGYGAWRALLVQVPRPEGRPVTRAEVPKLFSVLDGLQSEFRSQSFHQVLIEPVCNAGVVQTPRLGVFGWQRNYLLIGLPLLDGFSPDEMRAVLAHEFTHLSREHGRLTHWLYRLRRSWQEIFNHFSAPRQPGRVSLRLLVAKFVEFFWPRFNAHAFVLSRAHEYEADAQAARLTGNDNAGSALLRLNAVSFQLEDKLWPEVFKLANEQDQPPAGVFRSLRDSIRAGPSPEEAAQWLGEGLKTTSTNSDTHPCLTERLRALQVLPETKPGPPTESAAEAFFGPALEAIREDVEKLWCKDIQKQWRERHARANALKDRLSSIEQTSASAPDVDRLWDKAIALVDLEGGKAATPLLHQIIAMRPDHAPAQFHLGRLLVQENRAEGVTHLERAMELDEKCMPQAYALLHEHYRHSGQAAQLHELDLRMDRHEKALAASQAERREVKSRDTFIAHGLTDPELDALRKELEPELRILRAYLARKELKHFPTQRLFVLCVHSRRAWHGFPNHDLDRALVTRLSQKVRLPGRLIIFAPTGEFRAISRKVERVPDAKIFDRNS